MHAMIGKDRVPESTEEENMNEETKAWSKFVL